MKDRNINKLKQVMKKAFNKTKQINYAKIRTTVKSFEYEVLFDCGKYFIKGSTSLELYQGLGSFHTHIISYMTTELSKTEIQLIAKEMNLNIKGI